MERLRKFIAEHPYVNVIRYTTFFHQFTLVFDELQREKYVDWYGYSASVSPYILEQFEREAGYKFRPEFIIDQGYYQQPVPRALERIQGLPGVPAARGGKTGHGNGGHHPRAWARKP